MLTKHEFITARQFSPRPGQGEALDRAMTIIPDPRQCHILVEGGAENNVGVASFGERKGPSLNNMQGEL
jgi:hypothetical protein